MSTTHTLKNDFSSIKARDIKAMSISKIESLIGRLPDDNLRLLSLLERDRRIGVRRLAVRARRRQEKSRRERERLGRMLEIERRYWSRGISQVAGVDEVGRGCLAGPVVAAAVVLSPGASIPGLKDSKLLTPEKRESLFEEIMASAVSVGVGQVETAEIDRVNILEASMKAMRLALERLDQGTGQVLVDGNRPPGSGLPELTVVDGDERSASIAAASIVAKVNRDRLMKLLSKRFPHYGFDRNKGYGSAEHLQGLQDHGPCELHRRSFGPIADLLGRGRSETYRVLAEGLESCRDLKELKRMGEHANELTSELIEEELKSLRRIYQLRSRRLSNLGRRGEERAVRILERKGYRIIERGYRGAGGEIDLVAVSGTCTVFVEVKSGDGRSMTEPADRVGRRKRGHLIRAARQYLRVHARQGQEYRFDIIVVKRKGSRLVAEHLKDAFAADQ